MQSNPTSRLRLCSISENKAIAWDTCVAVRPTALPLRLPKFIG
jgi:hypothetical protein